MHPVFDQRRYLIPFRATLLPQIFTDVLVIGQGVAGMQAALEAARSNDVIIATKADVKKSSTYAAQGGVAAVLPPEMIQPNCNGEPDSFESHIQDTLTAGANLCNEQVVRQVVEDAPGRIQQILEYDMPFDRTEDNPDLLALGREGGHSHHRVLHAEGDSTGKALALTLDVKVRHNDNIRLFDNCFVLDLITLEPDNATTPRCLGAITHHPRYGLQVIWASATILASGGCGEVYRESTNPSTATGDGLAMAYRAGAKIADIAFMQFHPTTLYVAGSARALISEAVRGEGAHLIDRDGYRFMPEFHDLAELAPRDIVSRAILEQMARTGTTNVYLDCKPIGEKRFAQRFPGIDHLLRRFDLNPGSDPIPVHPSAHYMVGGVQTDQHGRTNIKGLYACGEAACTGLHGANRLASNSLLEGLVYGHIAGQAALEMLTDGATPTPVKIVSDIRLSDRSELDLADVRSSLRSVMWRHVGIERDGNRLAEVGSMFEFWANYTLDKIFDDAAGWEVQNLLLVGSLIIQSALWRTESRGTHYRLDYPNAVEEMRVHDLWQRGYSEPERVTV